MAPAPVGEPRARPATSFSCVEIPVVRLSRAGSSRARSSPPVSSSDFKRPTKPSTKPSKASSDGKAKLKREASSSPSATARSPSPYPEPDHVGPSSKKRTRSATTPSKKAKLDKVKEEKAKPSKGGKGKLSGPELVEMFNVVAKAPKRADFDHLIPGRTGKQLHDNWTKTIVPYITQKLMEKGGK